MCTVTVYLPSLSRGAMNAASTPQPRWIPQALLSWNGSDWQTCGNGDFAGASGLERWGNESGQNAVPACSAAGVYLSGCEPTFPFA